MLHSMTYYKQTFSITTLVFLGAVGLSSHFQNLAFLSGSKKQLHSESVQTTETTAGVIPYTSNILADKISGNFRYPTSETTDKNVTVGNDENRRTISSMDLTTDSDGDGVLDYLDLDDDNDGILDADESPECFYSALEANNISGVTSGFNPAAGNNIPNLYDGSTSTVYNFTAGQAVNPNDALLTITYPTAVPLTSLSVAQVASGLIATTNGAARLVGSNDGVNYVSLSNGINVQTTGTKVFTNLTPTVYYKYYQVRYIGTAVAGNTIVGATGAGNITEITNVFNHTVYIPSFSPKPGVCDNDLDGDGIPNHLDTDSDGDGCSDAFESGATTNKNLSTIAGPYGANGLANSLETATESGKINYVSTYYKYAVVGNQKLCVDSDGDGVPDPKDIDDDNDGVLDTDEGDFCGKLDRTLKVGYLNTATGSSGLTSNMLLNLENFGIYGTYNKVRGVTLVPLTTVTEVSLLANNIDIFYAGSASDNGNNNAGSSFKIPTAVNNAVIAWAQTYRKGVIAVQNNAVDYGYRTANNNANSMVSYQEKGKHVFANGYWPMTGGLDQAGTVQMTLSSPSRTFETLLVDANYRPTLISDTEYNLLVVPDDYLFSSVETQAVVSTDPRRAAANIWAHSFDRLLANECTVLDTDNDLTPNHLDLDSDGDGCSDATEAGATSTVSANFKFTGPDTNGDGLVNAVDPDGNGFPNYTSYYDIKAKDKTQNQCADSDGDTVLDPADLDDDNDGILDINEGQSCDNLNRNLKIGYVNTTLGRSGLMINMLSNPANFGPSGTYNKFPGITFVPYTDEAAVTAAQLQTDNVDIFYVGSSADESQATTDKMSTALNNRLYSWATTFDKGLVVLQNNAWDYGYTLGNGYDNSNPTKPYGPVGEAAFTNGYWPETVYNMTGTYTAYINSQTRNFITTMVDAQGKSVFIKDRDARITFFPDATSYISNQTASAIGTNATLRIAADTWAYAFDTYIVGKCSTRDTDGDGIPDHLDLDSDNDGCPDAREGAGNFNPSTTATGLIASQTPNINFGTNSNTTTGIPNAVGGGQGIGQSLNFAQNDCLDSDGDSIPDWQDLDDDNDGILDTVECPPFLASYTAAKIAGATTNSATVSGISFGGITGTLTRVHNGNTVKSDELLSMSASDMSNANIFTPIGATNQAVLKETIVGTKGSSFYTRYTLTLNAPVESITLHAINFDFMKTRFVGATAEQLVTGGTEFIYNPGTRELYDNNPITHSTLTRDGYGSVRITNANGTPITQINFDRIDDPSSTFANDGFFYTFSVQPICDTDGDGIPDRLDLDADNDGCSDAIEGAASLTALVNSSMPGGNANATSGTFNQSVVQNLGNDVNLTVGSNSYGVPLVAGSGQAVGTSQAANPVLVAGTASANQLIQSGTTPQTLVVTGATGAIQWQVSSNNSTFTNVTTGTGGTTANYSPGNLNATTYYRALVTSVGGCTVMSNVITITVCNAGAIAPNFNNYSSGGNIFYSRINSAYSLNCGAGLIANLSVLTVAPAAPSGTIVTWHSATPATDANRINPVTAVPGATRKVYAAFYDSANSCYSPTREVTIYGPICATADDFTATPVLYGVPTTLPISLTANDTYLGVAIGAPNPNVSIAWELGNAAVVINANGTLTFNTTSPTLAPGIYTYYYKICDTDPDAVADSNCAVGEVKFRIITCTNPPAAGTPASYTQTGISSLEGFAGGTTGWPGNVPNGFIAIESKNQGFVITRVSSTSVITNPELGMMVYDMSNSPTPCVKLYSDLGWNCLAKDCLPSATPTK